MKKFKYVLIVIVFLTLAVCLILTVIKKTNSANREGLSIIWEDSEELNELSTEIIKDKVTDKAKVQAIYDWIKANIRYDYEADMLYQYFNIEKTIETRMGICFDYSSLFAALCRKEKIPCYIVDGYSRVNSTYRHTWNRVFFDGTWWNLDVTFDAVEFQSDNSKLYGFKNIGKDYEAEDSEYVITRIY